MFMAKSAESKVSTDHDEIRRWAEERGAKPTCVRGTGGGGDIGMLRLDFPGYSGEESLQPISWDEWFDKFDERGLALLHQQTTAGGERSNFNKLVSRETASEIESGHRGSKRSGKSSAKKTAKKTSSSGASKKTPAKSAYKTGGRTGAKTSYAKKASAGKSSGKKSSPKKAGGKKSAAKKSSRSR
jgi:hypothetical protein